MSTKQRRLSISVSDELKRYQNRATDVITDLIRAADHWHCCDYPDEVEFRCEQCQDAEEAMKAAKKFLKGGNQ